MAHIDTVVIGASAGGVEALTRLFCSLQPDLQASMFVVMHFPENARSVLPTIIQRNCALQVHHGLDGEVTRLGEVYVAPPGTHMLVADDRVVLSAAMKENGHRPAIDALFRSAAYSRGPRVISVLLSGMLDDGTIGTGAVKMHGGVTMAQDPSDSLYGDLARNAIEQVGVDYVLDATRLSSQIGQLVGREVPDVSEPVLDPASIPPSELQQFGTLLEATQLGTLENALWTSLRTVRQHNAFLQALIKRAKQQNLARAVAHYQAALDISEDRLGLIEDALGLQHVGQGPAGQGD